MIRNKAVNFRKNIILRAERRISLPQKTKSNKKQLPLVYKEKKRKQQQQQQNKMTNNLIEKIERDQTKYYHAPNLDPRVPGQKQSRNNDSKNNHYNERVEIFSIDKNEQRVTLSPEGKTNKILLLPGQKQKEDVVSAAAVSSAAAGMVVAGPVGAVLAGAGAAELARSNNDGPLGSTCRDIGQFWVDILDNTDTWTRRMCQLD